MEAPKTSRAWQAWPDFAAFAAGIVFAAYYGWDTGRLVWGLWLASLVIGYTMIVAAITRVILPDAPFGRSFSLGGLFLGLFLLAFFTFHFGGFHYGHSVFLNLFFPIDGSPANFRGSPFPTAADYFAVVKENWWFVLLAFVAQRSVFFPAPAAASPDHLNLKTKTPGKFDIFAPYKNVVRLHLLIFFFAFAQILKLPGVLIYLVVYTVYFLPVWPKKKATAPEN